MRGSLTLVPTLEALIFLFWLELSNINMMGFVLSYYIYFFVSYGYLFDACSLLLRDRMGWIWIGGGLVRNWEK